MSSLLRLLFSVVLVVLTAGPHVRAQSDAGSVYATGRPGTNTRSPFEWLLGRPRQSAEPARAARPKSYQPRRRGTVPPKALPVPGDGTTPAIADGMPPDAGAPGAQPADGAPAVASQPVVPAQPPVTVAVVGDSLSVFLGQGLADLYAERPSVSFVKRNRESSGLVREDYFDWPKALAEVLAQSPKPDAVLIMIGSNDRQQLRDDKGVHEPLSDPWRVIYGQRIDAMITLARDANVPLIWVGLPTMRAVRYSADLLALNDAYRSRSQNAGSIFVDVWEAFASEDGSYTATGPDVEGELVRLRTSDGVHFTKAGARKLAFFADRELQKIVAAVQSRSIVPSPVLPESGSGVSIAPAPGAMPSAVVIPAVPATIDQLLGVALPDAPLMSTLAPRPLHGAVMALTAPPISAGGRLAGPGRAPAGLPSPTLSQGAGPTGKPGRADDFRLNSY